MIEEIFHVFLESKTALYIGDLKHVNIEVLNNSAEISDLTQQAFQSILQ